MFIKTLAIILNISLIVTAIYLTQEIGSDEVWYIILFIAAPAFSLIEIFKKNGHGLLNLYLHRKVLEEKKRIEDLKK